MATLDSELITSPVFVKQSGVTTSQDAVADFTQRITLTFDAPIATDRTFVVETMTPETLDAELISAFFDLFYNSIHITPLRIDFGNVVNNEVRLIEIWNAFLSSSVDLTSIVETDVAGSTLDGTVPDTIGALETRIFTLTVASLGAPSFHTFYDFIFTGHDMPALEILGQRVIVFPFKHNWNSQVNEELAFLTQVYESDDCTEQRVMFRSGVPRRSLEYDAVLTPMLDTGLPGNQADYRLALSIFRALVYGWQHRKYAVPIWTDEQLLLSGVTAGDTVVTLDTTTRSYEIGDYVVFFQSPFKYELVEIDDIDNVSITLARPAANDWAAGKTAVIPATLMRIADTVEPVEEAMGISTVKVKFAVEPDRSYTRRIGSVILPTYRGIPVFTRIHDSSQIATESIGRRIVILDASTGLQDVVAHGGAPRSRLDFRAALKDRADFSAFLGFLHQRTGRLKPCWWPSWQFDMQLADTIAAGANAISVKTFGYTNLYAEGSNRIDIMIRLVNGTVYYRRITGAAVSTDGLTEVLALEAVIADEIAPAAVDRISFMRLARLDSDKITLVWQTTSVVTCQFRNFDLITNGS